jgi:uncharacterized protein DUF3558
LAVVLVVLFATACTKSEAGQPSASGGSESTSESARPTSQGPAPTVAIPPRPKDLRLDGVDPCSLFTKPQLAQIKIDRTRKTTDGTQQYNGMAKCELDQTPAPFDHYYLTAATNEGIGAWLTGKRNVEAHLSSVAGYAAATYWIRGASGTHTDSCHISIDVAEGQQLMVTADNDGKHSYTLEQLCQRVEQVGGFAVQTLQTLK